MKGVQGLTSETSKVLNVRAKAGGKKEELEIQERTERNLRSQKREES